MTKEQTPSRVITELATKEKMLVLYQDYNGVVTSEDGSHSIAVHVFMAEDGVMYISLEDSPNKEEEEALLAKSLVEMAEIASKLSELKKVLERAAVEDIA